jgi:uncharacterized protein (DUF302 family)
MSLIRKLFLTFSLLLLSGQASSFVEIPSRMNVTDTVNEIISNIGNAKGFKVFAVVDHEKNAMSVSMKMPQTVLIIFGNPKGGTMLMKANPLMAYELPLKILVTHKRGKTIISYRDPNWFANVYGLYGSPIITKIDRVMKKLVSSCL